MVSTIFTALALIATGQVQLPPVPPESAPAREARPLKADRRSRRG